MSEFLPHEPGASSPPPGWIKTPHETQFYIHDSDNFYPQPGEKNTFLHIELLDSPLRNVELSVKTDSDEPSSMVFTGRVGLEIDSLSADWMEEFFASKLNSSDFREYAAEAGFEFSEDGDNCFVASNNITGSSFGVVLEKTAEGWCVAFSNGSALFPHKDDQRVDDRKEVRHRNVSAGNDETLVDFLGVFSMMVRSAVSYRYAQQLPPKDLSFPPADYLLNAHPGAHPVVDTLTSKTAHRQIFERPIFRRFVRDVLRDGSTFELPAYDIDPDLEKTDPAQYDEELMDYIARSAEVLVVPDDVETLLGLNEDEIEVLTDLCTDAHVGYALEEYSNRGLMLIGRNHDWRSEVAEAFTNTVDANEVLELEINKMQQRDVVRSLQRCVLGFYSDAEEPASRVVKIDGIDQVFGEGRNRPFSRVLAGEIAKAMKTDPNLYVIAGASRKRNIPAALREEDVFNWPLKLKPPTELVLNEVILSILSGRIIDRFAEGQHDLYLRPEKIDISQLAERMKGMWVPEIRQAILVAETFKIDTSKKSGAKIDPLKEGDILKAVYDFR